MYIQFSDAPPPFQDTYLDPRLLNGSKLIHPIKIVINYFNFLHTQKFSFQNLLKSRHFSFFVFNFFFIFEPTQTL